MPQDASTICDLIPSTDLFAKIMRFKNSAHNHGSHFLNLRRASRLPAETRKYVKGDPPNLIDWKAYARTDALLIREIKDEATAHVLVICDARLSMQWPMETECVRKLEIAIRLALNVCYWHARQGDRVNFVVLDDKPFSWEEQFFTIDFRSAAGVLDLFHSWSVCRFLREEIFDDLMIGDIKRKSDIIFFISDFIEPPLWNGFSNFAGLKNFIQVLHSRERTIEWVDSESCYFDETVEKKEYLGSVLANEIKFNSIVYKWIKNLIKQVRLIDGSFFTLSEAITVHQLSDKMKTLFE